MTDQPTEQAAPSVVPDAPVGTPVVTGPPECRWCGGRGYYIGGDEEHVCWCKRDEAEAAGKPLSW